MRACGRTRACGIWSAKRCEGSLKGLVHPRFAVYTSGSFEGSHHLSDDPKDFSIVKFAARLEFEVKLDHF